MKRYLFFLIVLLSFCFNWNRVEAKSKTSREEKGCTKLDHNRFRYYDSNSGAYISKDLIGLVGILQICIRIPTTPIPKLIPGGLIKVKP